MSELTAITDGNFEEDVLKSDVPVLVDFWAPWCGPCKNLMPIVEEVAGEMSNIKVVKMNIDESPETPSKYGVRGIPTLMLFKNGELLDAKIGGLAKNALASWISEKV